MPQESVGTLAAWLSRVPIFAGLLPAEQEDVAAHGHCVELAQGERLYGAGERLARFFVVGRGRIRIVRSVAPGHDQLIRIAGPSDLVGEYPLLTGRLPVVWALADEPSLVCAFEHDDLKPLMKKYPAIAERLLTWLAHRLGDTERRLAVLAGADVPTRLADYLLALPGGVVGHRSPGVHLPMSKKDLASYLGTTPESLSRALHRLHGEGFIRVGQRGWVEIADRNGLESLTDGMVGS